MANDIRERALKALNALKDFGIEEKRVKPTLKRLLKLYDNNWELIEDENYRVLLDAIFEQEIEVNEEKKNTEAQIVDEPSGPPLKRLRSRSKEDQVCSSGETHIRGKETESSPSRRRSSRGTCFKEPKLEPGIIIQPKEKLHGFRQNRSSIKPKSEPTDSTDPPFEIPVAVVTTSPIAIAAPSNSEGATNDDPVHIDGSSIPNGFPVQSNGSPEHECSVEPLVPSNKHNGISGGACSTSTSPDLGRVSDAHKRFEIASSSSGEVKISLNCNHTFERPDFSIPSLEAVMKAVEDKCLKSYRILEPKFSMQKLMQEICQSFVEFTSTPPNPKDSCIQLTSDFDFLKKSNLQNAFAPKSQLPGNLSNGSINLECSAETPPSTLLLEAVPNSTEDCDPNSPKSQSLILAPQDVCKVDEGKPLHDVNDLSRGEEKIQISVINEVSSEPYPPKFYYIPRNTVYQNAYVNFSIARIGDEDCCANCFGNCLSSCISCACARETGGEFAYTLEGRVKEKFLDECISMNKDPEEHRHFYCKECPLERSKEGLTDSCKGHLVRRFIKECWNKCGCNIQCGNRVVQRGISCNLQVFFTPEGKGWGLRTLEDLPRGSFVCEYVGEILTNNELFDRNTQSKANEKHTYPVLLDADWGSEGVLKDEEALCLDATYYGNVARFINHRCVDGNLVEIPVEIETPDHHYYHLAFFTARDVKALEELTWDYGIDFGDKKHPVKGFRCQCRSKFCREMKRSRRSKAKRW